MTQPEREDRIFTDGMIDASGMEYDIPDEIDLGVMVGAEPIKEEIARRTALRNAAEDLYGAGLLLSRGDGLSIVARRGTRWTAHIHRQIGPVTAEEFPDIHGFLTSRLLGVNDDTVYVAHFNLKTRIKVDGAIDKKLREKAQPGKVYAATPPLRRAVQGHLEQRVYDIREGRANGRAFVGRSGLAVGEPELILEPYKRARRMRDPGNRLNPFSGSIVVAGDSLAFNPVPATSDEMWPLLAEVNALARKAAEQG